MHSGCSHIIRLRQKAVSWTKTWKVKEKSHQGRVAALLHKIFSITTRFLAVLHLDALAGVVIFWSMLVHREACVQHFVSSQFVSVPEAVCVCQGSRDQWCMLLLGKENCKHFVMVSCSWQELSHTKNFIKEVFLLAGEQKYWALSLLQTITDNFS